MSTSQAKENLWKGCSAFPSLVLYGSIPVPCRVRLASARLVLVFLLFVFSFLSYSDCLFNVSSVFVFFSCSVWLLLLFCFISSIFFFFYCFWYASLSSVMLLYGFFSVCCLVSGYLILFFVSVMLYFPLHFQFSFLSSFIILVPFSFLYSVAFRFCLDYTFNMFHYIRNMFHYRCNSLSLSFQSFILHCIEFPS